MALAGDVAGLSPAAGGFLWIAAGAAFMDRVAEGFIGREALRAEILVLMASAAFAGAGAAAFAAGVPFGAARKPLQAALCRHRQRRKVRKVRRNAERTAKKRKKNLPNRRRMLYNSNVS